MTSSVTVLVSIEHLTRDFIYRRKVDGEEFVLDTREIKNILEGVPLGPSGGRASG